MTFQAKVSLLTMLSPAYYFRDKWKFPFSMAQLSNFPQERKRGAMPTSSGADPKLRIKSDVKVFIPERSLSCSVGTTATQLAIERHCCYPEGKKGHHEKSLQVTNKTLIYNLGLFFVLSHLNNYMVTLVDKLLKGCSNPPQTPPTQKKKHSGLFTSHISTLSGGP